MAQREHGIRLRWANLQAKGKKKPKTWSLAPARGSLAMGVVAGDSAG